VIYWAWNNVLSLLQQYAIMRKNNTEVHLWKNLGVDKWKVRLAAARKLDVATVRSKVGAASAAGAQTLGKALKRPATKSAPAAETKPVRTEAPKAEPRVVADVPKVAEAPKDEAPRKEPATPMTREQALKTLGLELDATDFEIKMALRDTGGGAHLNGSDHALPAKIVQARDILRGKEGT
jgi:hypothetical protein